MHNDPKNKCEVKRGTCKTSEKNGVHRRGWPCLPQNKNRRDDAIAPAVLQIYYVCLGPKSCIESPHCMTEKIRKPTKNITNKIIASWLLHPSSLAKTEHSHPLGMVVSTHFRCGKGVKRGLKNGALPFKID